MRSRLEIPRMLVLAMALGLATLGAGPRAPRITSSQWYNSPPLSATDLDGKVRLVEFWAFDCINCNRTIPAMKALHERFAGPDAVVIGVHSPELKQERDPKNVVAAIRRFEIHYPVALDNDHAIWRAFNNEYWPALYVIDKHGVIRDVHIGELHQGTREWDALVELVDRLRHEPA